MYSFFWPLPVATQTVDVLTFAFYSPDDSVLQATVGHLNYLIRPSRTPVIVFLLLTVLARPTVLEADRAPDRDAPK